MHASSSPLGPLRTEVLEILILLSLGVLGIAYLGLLIYLIVTKKHQLAALLTLVPAGLLLALVTLFIGVRPHAVEDTAVTISYGIPVVAEAEYHDSDSALTAGIVEQRSTRRHSPVAGHSHKATSKQRPAWIFLIILMAGTFGVAWVSNLLTQGYYRQTINYTLVTTIVVIVALMLLALSIGATHVAAATTAIGIVHVNFPAAEVISLSSWSVRRS